MQIKVGSHLIEPIEIGSHQIQLLLGKYHGNSAIPITCTCNPKALMHIRKVKNRFLLSTNPNKLKEHVPYCENGLNLDEKEMQGTHYRVIEVVDEFELRVNARHLPIFMKEPNESNTLTGNPSTRAYTASSMTLGSFGREWLSRAWEYAIEEYQRDKRYYPSVKVLQITLDKLFLSASAIYNVKLNKKTSLSDVLWIGQKKPQSFYYYNQKKIRPVVLCKLVKEDVRYDEKTDTMILPLVSTLKDTFYEVAVTMEHWENAKAVSRISYDKHEHFFVTGFGVAGPFNQLPRIEKLELIPVTERGMFIDSSYEANLFKAFESHRRIYKRPNQRMDELDGYLPDALLMDTEKPCIVEVFGMSESNESYHESKNRKMQFYRTLDHYSTYYWHAYRATKFPPIPAQKNSLLIITT